MPRSMLFPLTCARTITGNDLSHMPADSGRCMRSRMGARARVGLPSEGAGDEAIRSLSSFKVQRVQP
ncbi:MAG: hypothetical protein STSR0001_14190 [Methanothrix sp.]